MLKTCRRVRPACEEALYKSTCLTIVITEKKQKKKGAAAPLEKTLDFRPRKLLECIGTSPRCARLAAHLSSVRIEVIASPRGLHSAWVRKAADRLTTDLQRIAPKSICVRLDKPDNKHVQQSLSYVLEKLSCRRVQNLDMPAVPGFHRLLVRCATTLRRLHFPDGIYPDPAVEKPPPLPYVRKVIVNHKSQSTAALYIIAALTVAPVLSTLKLASNFSMDNHKNDGQDMAARLLAVVPDSLDSLWIGTSALAAYSGPAPSTLALSRFCAMRTLTLSTVNSSSLTSLPPNLHNLRFEALKGPKSAGPQGLCAFQQELVRRLGDTTWQPWQPRLATLVMPDLARYPSAPQTSLPSSALKQACELRNVRLVQWDRGAWWIAHDREL